VLKYIEDRLRELDDEKRELNEYQVCDKERRSLEYTIYAREQASAHNKLEDLDYERGRFREHNEQQIQTYTQNEKAVNVSNPEI
jgi:structural maintenance of chromosome 3 (chondroitin sulfate proteoglycan 6)